MANPNNQLPPQWRPTTSSSSSQTPSTSSTSSSSQQQFPSYSQFQPPPQYPPAFAPRSSSQSSRSPQSQQGQFYHYQPTPARPDQSNVTTARHQVTAPFQVPRMPHPWPYPGANREELARGGASGSVPIDPALLGAGGQGARSTHSPAPPSGWQRQDPGQQGGWPGSRGQ